LYTEHLHARQEGDASSRTTSAIAPGTIDIRENPTQDISALSRDTENALNELGRIFDKKKIEEQQELAAVFGEEAFRLAHNMKDDGSGRKIAAHAIIGGIMSQITGAGFGPGAVGAGLNEALINAVKGKDPGTAQIVNAIIGTHRSCCCELSKMGALTRVTTRTAKIADRTVTIGGDVWKKGGTKRGQIIDGALGNNLGRNFPKVDKLDNGVAVSIKSIKLSDKTYETAKGIYNKLRRDVDKLDSFTEKEWNDVSLKIGDYSSKKLEIAVQDMKITAEQQRGLEMVKEYAKEKGIEITITLVK